jgi:hypothetical protein
MVAQKTAESIESVVHAFYAVTFSRSQHFLLCLELCRLLQGNFLDGAQVRVNILTVIEMQPVTSYACTDGHSNLYSG